MALHLHSPAFHEGQDIPTVFTCDDRDISPPLAWHNAPEKTKSFVLIMHDPDAPRPGGFTHWILFNIPSHIKNIPENIQSLPEGTQEGQNTWGRTGYGGPCPPEQRKHHYYFKLYALDTTLTISTKTAPLKDDIETSMYGHILAEASLMGLYQRTP